MGSPVPIDPAQLAILKGSFGKDGLPMPFVQELFLIEVHVAGTSYRDLDEIAPWLKPGDLLVLKREPDNPYDELAIAIYDEQGHHLGYVPRDSNEVLARLMDGGKLLFGKICAKEWVNDWLRIDVKIHMRDV